MSKRDFIIFLEDIITSINKIEKYTYKIKFKEFLKNEMMIDAVIRNLEIIGEAVKNLPQEIKDKYPEVEWKEATGFRNILIHNYFGIDIETVWETIKKDLPIFKKKIEKILQTEKSSKE